MIQMGNNTGILTGLAMIAFAANSVLCRMALGGDMIDAASFTTIRMMSGALFLMAIILFRDKGWRPARPNGPSVLALAIYMAFFSFAYRSLSAGTGALLLFGFVQLTMVSAALYHKDRFSPLGWVGLLLAISGMVYLLIPGLEAPDIFSSIIMSISGMAWGVYSLLGKNNLDPTTSTASNFLYAAPLVTLASIVQYEIFHISLEGFAIALISGTVTSGLGYVIWYKAIKNITSTLAATVQLSVPALATLGGVLFLSEPLSLRIIIATIMTIGGIAIVLNQPVKRSSV